MSELKDKVAIVTGAARGLGAAIAEVFVREGAKVVLTDVLDAEGQAIAERFGGAARFLHHDVGNAGQWADAVSLAQSAFGRVDILVNNAGLVGMYPFESTTDELWAKLIGVMQTGPYLGMRTVIPVMKAAGGGAIVNIASTNSIRGMAATAAYTSAKHGVLGLTRALALEYAPAGIRINAVCPGAMRTPMLRESFGDQMEDFAAHIPAGRLADPREIAEIVSFLASPRASFVIGVAYVVDGGMTVS